MANFNTCVVCGRSSTRATWNNNNVYGSTYVACDFHSQAAIQASVQANDPPVPLKVHIPVPFHERGSS
jgi:Zn ribbon nucleic-acid-binding protein